MPLHVAGRHDSGRAHASSEIRLPATLCRAQDRCADGRQRRRPGRSDGAPQLSDFSFLPYWSRRQPASLEDMRRDAGHAGRYRHCVAFAGILC